MNTVTFEIQIMAAAKVVWHAMWNSNFYKQWTSAFTNGSYYKTDALQQGNIIEFLNPTGDGMFCSISICEPFSKMSFTVQGQIKNFERLPQDEKIAKWIGATENYELIEGNNTTTVKVTMDMDEEYEEYFKTAFPKGLNIIKENAEKMTLTVTTEINASIEKVWNYFILPEHIMQWNNANDDWHTPKASNTLIVGEKFSYTMAAKDGSMSFDFWGTYTNIQPQKVLASTMGDGRSLNIQFEAKENTVMITETFEPETMNDLEMQQMGWQAILNNFKKYTEAN